MNNQNKQIDKIIEEVFLKYSIYQVRLRNAKLYQVQPLKNNFQEMEYFIKQIDEILETFPKDEREFIINVYVKKMSKYDIPISVSNFYYRKRKYNDILYKCLYLI